MTATIIDVAVATTIAEILQRASELSDSGAHGHALALLDGALESYPGDAEVHTARGWALENLEPARLVDARAAYEAAVAIDAGQLWARVGLATVLGQLGLSHLCPPILDDALLRHPSVAAEAAPLREQLARALQTASNGRG